MAIIAKGVERAFFFGETPSLPFTPADRAF